MRCESGCLVTHLDTRVWVGAIDGVVGAKLAWVGAKLAWVGAKRAMACARERLLRDKLSPINRVSVCLRYRALSGLS